MIHEKLVTASAYVLFSFLRLGVPLQIHQNALFLRLLRLKLEISYAGRRDPLLYYANS